MPNEYEKCYKVLNLDVGAFKDEVKRTWRELTQIYYSDYYARKSPEVQNKSEEKFNDINIESYLGCL